MKARWFVLPVVIVLFMTGACSIKELDLIQDKEFSQELVFTAQSAESRTKTALQADEKSIWWSPGDEISIFYGASEGCRFTSTNTEEVAKTVFRGTLDAFTGETEAGDFNYFWAVYPYSSAVSCDGSSLVANLSDHQVGKSGTFAPNTNIAIAKSLGLSLGFYNACSWFRFSIKKEGVKRVIFRGNNNEDVAGKFSVSMDSNGTPTAPTVVDGKKEIVLTMPNDGTFTVGEMYYITLLPQVFQNGFTVAFETDGESGSRSISFQATYLRSKYNTGVDFDKNVVYSPQPFTITSTGITSVGINKSGTPDDIVLEYKKGDGDWTSYTIGSSIDLADGQTLQFRAGVSGNDKFSSDYANYYYVVASGLGTINVSGNIMSLLDRSLERTTLTSAIFNHLFKDCSKLVDASNLVLPATTLAADCYYWMFSRCTSLTTAPALPATTLADNCYESMFLECSSLTTAPALPATTLAKECYCDMFSDCTSLTTAPALPATTMRTGCYCDMFRHCTSLTIAPALPATTLAKECYSAMFIGCSSLSTAPELPASTLSTYCYESMFSDCTNLITAPELPATSLESGCYEMMFYGCSNLSYIKALFTSNPSYGQYTSGWVSGVSATGTFVKNSSATWDVSGNNGVPSGWTVLSATPTPEPVDLGLSVKWATCNLGASTPEEVGNYYAWGEIFPKDRGSCSWTNYSLCNGTGSYFYKYNSKSGCGPVDNKFSLDPEDDAAYVTYGEEWRIPSTHDWRLLRDYCSWTWVEHDGIQGFNVTSRVPGYEGVSIFIPRVTTGDYWSNERYPDITTSYKAMCYYASHGENNNIVERSESRYVGMLIRPVKDCLEKYVTGVAIDKTEITLRRQETETISATTTTTRSDINKQVWYYSSDNTIAIVDESGLVTAISEGTATITACSFVGSYSASCTVHVTHEAVDLGLPSGTKWSSCNLGADTPEQKGDCYSWGEINPRNSFTMSSYKFYKSYSDGRMQVTKYCTNALYGTIDNRTVLVQEDDAAHAKLGGTWRIPTKEDIEELIANCKWTKNEDQWGVAGFIATGPSGNSIYFPAYIRDEDGDYSSILSSTLVSSRNDFYHFMQCRSPYDEIVHIDGGLRYDGMPIRPVCD